jgi:predicted pyridoxine 5'-phosphate oxidase superfamily flavin-nucleotide-binding protein
MYHQGQRALQQRFDTRALADRLEAVKVRPTLSLEDQAFIAARDMFFLATADADGRPTCSYKGGEPGFVRVVDCETLAFPCYDGNGMFLSFGNTLVNPHVGLLFLDFEGQRRLRVNGVASVDDADPLAAEFPEAQFIVRVRIREVFPNCPRYLHRYRLVERSAFVPRAGVETPVPGWKRADWACDVLPARDPARRSPSPAEPDRGA